MLKVATKVRNYIMHLVNENAAIRKYRVTTWLHFVIIRDCGRSLNKVISDRARRQMIRDYISGREGASQSSERLEVVPSLLSRTVELHTTTPNALAAYEVYTRGSHLVYFLLGISLASNCSWPTFRNPVSVPSSKAGCTV